MDTLTHLIILGLAVWQTVETLHHSELFYGWREVANEIVDQKQGLVSPDLGLFAAKAYSCPYCLAHWVAILYAALLYTPLHGVVSWWSLALAAVRIANIGNDLVGDRCRTPRYTEEDTKEEEQHDKTYNGT
jgi:hypothetical protein